MRAKDVQLDSDGDINISRGDFVIAESDDVHIEHILRSNKGFWFDTPLLGVGIIDEQNGSRTRQELKQNIRRQLVLDNFAVRRITISETNQIDINAVRRI